MPELPPLPQLGRSSLLYQTVRGISERPIPDPRTHFEIFSFALLKLLKHATFEKRKVRKRRKGRKGSWNQYRGRKIEIQEGKKRRQKGQKGEVLIIII